MLNEDYLSFDKISEIRAVLLNYAFYWEDDEILKKLGDVSDMHEDFILEPMKRYGELLREEGREEGIEEGKEEGRKELKYEIANELISNGYSPEEVSKISHLSLPLVNQIIMGK